MGRTLTPRPPLRLSAGLLAALLGFVDAPAEAQPRGRGTLELTVTVAATGEPIHGAVVEVQDTRLQVVTDEGGRAHLAGVPEGERLVRVGMLGMETREISVLVQGGATLQMPVRMELQPIELEAVRAEASIRTRGTRMLHSAGFYERKAIGNGRFLTRAEIERMQPRFVSDVLRRTTSLAMQANLFSRSRVASRRSGAPQAPNRCETQVFMNGIPTGQFEIDEVNPEDIEGIEIYDGAADVPPAFTRGTSLCGAIVIWVRIN
ncbi:MAG TPA: carboxypeptidase regulatory-like domain-containing protein [Longimicrobium sp.]|nr:carboxypeptidase regulatory-like domain-containing protein [Longimicrobium sp.]